MYNTHIVSFYRRGGGGVNMPACCFTHLYACIYGSVLFFYSWAHTCTIVCNKASYLYMRTSSCTHINASSCTHINVCVLLVVQQKNTYPCMYQKQPMPHTPYWWHDHTPYWCHYTRSYVQWWDSPTHSTLLVIPLFLFTQRTTINTSDAATMMTNDVTTKTGMSISMRSKSFCTITEPRVSFWLPRVTCMCADVLTFTELIYWSFPVVIDWQYSSLGWKY